MTTTAETTPSLHDPLPTPTVTVPWDDLLPHRVYLVNFARRKLHDPSLAEDLVHDVFEAVATGRASFAGRSALRTWLTAILKYKIVDMVRQRAGVDSLDEDTQTDGLQVLVSPHPGPDKLAEHRQTLQHTLHHITCLPQGQRAAVEMRILQDRPSLDVCRALAITENNLLQRLFKARRFLTTRMPLAFS